MPRQTSHIPKTKTLLERMGYQVGKVEKWIPQSRKNKAGKWEMVPFGKKVDLFGIADLVAINPNQVGSTYVQICAKSGLSDHWKKAMASPVLVDLLRAANRFVMIGWFKTVTPGGAVRWKYQWWDAALDGDRVPFRLQKEAE